MGNASGGLCVQKMGGIPALPTKEDIEAFWHKENRKLRKKNESVYGGGAAVH